MSIEEIYSAPMVGTTYLFLQAPALGLAIWSFKLNKDLFSATPSDDNSGEYYGKGITKHEKGGILGAGVCSLGKFAGWLIIAQTLLSTGLLFSTSHKEIDNEKTVLGTGIVNSILILTLIITASVMNPQLSIRTLPFYFIQIGVILYLFSIYLLIRRFKKYKKCEDKEK
jgi:purine-cytosine permease-like protein